MTQTLENLIQQFKALDSDEQSTFICRVMPEYATTDPTIGMRAFWAHQAGLPPEKRPQPPELSPEDVAELQRRIDSNDTVSFEEMMELIEKGIKEESLLSASLQ